MNINGQLAFSKDNSRNTFLYGNIAEYDKLFQNGNKISKVNRGSSMKQVESGLQTFGTETIV